MAASFVPAGPGACVLEGGTGAGAGLLCLSARVPGLIGIGIEADPALAGIATANFKANGAQCRAEIGRLPELPDGLGQADHAFANPPWHDPASTASPDGARRLARQRLDDTLADWAGALASALAEGGTLTLIVPAALHALASDALVQARCGGLTLFPLWPRAGREAKLVMLQGRRGSRSPARVLAGMVLHEADGTFTPAAQAVLRDGAPALAAVGGSAR